MKRKKNLVVLTNQFPFGIGEEFLETEIKYLSKEFEKITIISSSKDKNLTRTIPFNTEVYNIKKSLTIYDKTFLTSVLKELFLIYKMRKLFKPKVLKYLLIYILNFFWNYKNLKEILNSIKNKNVKTIVYSYWANENLYTALLLKKKYPEFKFVTRTHGYDLYLERNQDKYIPFRNFVYRNVDLIITISDSGKKYLLNNFPFILPNKIETSKLGIYRSPGDKNENESLIKQQKELFIVTCSSLSPVKRIHLLIKELSLISNINIRWVHIGDGILSRDLKSLAKNLLESKKNISYSFIGHISNNEIYKFYRENRVDIFVNISESEGIPVSFMEAQSFGIPIIATKVGGVPEIVNEQNGFLIDKDFKEGTLKKVINQFLKINNEDLLLLRRAAFLTWKKQYHSEINYTKFSELLKRL
jgi:glycosyltransferase involved in cell wall biosynthesis